MNNEQKFNIHKFHLYLQLKISFAELFDFILIFNMILNTQEHIKGIISMNVS